MKRFYLILAASFLSFSLFAQGPVNSISFRPEIGVQYSNIITSVTWNTTPKIGVVGGVEMEYQLSKRLALSGGVLFSQEGASLGLNLDNGSTLEGNKLDMNYLNIPILLNYYFYKGLAFKIGAQPGYAIISKYWISSDPKAAADASFKKFDLAGVAGISWEINHLVFDLRYNIGALDYCNKETLYSTFNNSYVSFTVGYRFGGK